jgi:carbonic anhydrase/acetyltransferase-like protein (isoleucine patch superfamily)
MALVAPGAHVIGDVTFGEGCSVWYNAVVRGDESPIRVGRLTNIQDNAVIHVDPTHSATLGDGVTVGHGAVVHGATVGDNTVIGMGAVVLNGAKIGSNCIVAAGTVVPERRKVPDGTIVYGNPARKLRDMTSEDVEANAANASSYLKLAQSQPTKWTVC